MRCHMSVRIRLLRPFRLTENHRCVGRKTEITVSSGELSDSIIVIVKKDIIEKLDVSLAALSLDGGEEQKVTAKLTPSDAKDVSLSWKSADTEVATVDKDGNIKGVNTGETTVTVTDSVTGLSKDISVTVNGLELPDSMEFDKRVLLLRSERYIIPF